MTVAVKRKFYDKGAKMMEENRLLLSKQFSVSFLCLILTVGSVGYTKTVFRAIEIFPLVKQHVHGSTVVELPNGDILAAWFQGSGERWADDVAIMGARLKAGKQKWSKPFVMADVPEFPDINPILFLDPRGRLWLMWYTVIANQWETSLPKYRISEDYTRQDGPPKWSWQEVLHVKPGDSSERGIQPGDRFVKSIERQIEEYVKYLSESANLSEQIKRKILERRKAWGAKQLGYAYFRRMGWQTKNKAVIVNKNRMIIPFYSDGFSFSLMAITDDCGKNWQFSEPLVGPGNIQPSIAIKADGTLVTGPPPQRLHISTSKDAGLTWSTVKDSELPNPGSGADIVTLRNGHWALSYNDTEDGRHSLAVSISTNEGKSWDYTRHLERDMRDRNIATSSGYPSITQGLDDTLHVVYSYHHKDRRGEPSNTIKYVQFNAEWIRQE